MHEFKKINIGAEEFAEKVFKSINEESPSIYSLIKWVEEQFNIKISIFHREMAIGHSGLVYPDASTGKYVIWINSKESELRQNFTLCHEIAHIIRSAGLSFGFSSGDIYTKNGQERFCNRFAAAFLMPSDLFIEKWKSSGEKILFKKVRMTQIFKVSGEAVHYRAVELGLINERR